MRLFHCVAAENLAQPACKTTASNKNHRTKPSVSSTSALAVMRSATALLWEHLHVVCGPKVWGQARANAVAVAVISNHDDDTF